MNYQRKISMYTHSTTRRLAVATVLVATLASSLVAGIERGTAAFATTAPAPRATLAQERLPMLPEVVITATRLAD
jgi:hypothetical protein